MPTFHLLGFSAVLQALLGLIATSFVADFQGVWKHSNCSLWEQGWCEEQAGQSKAGYFPPEEEFAVLRDISKKQL